MPRVSNAEKSAGLAGVLWRERRIYVQSEGRTRYLRLTPLAQWAMATSVAAMILWSATAGALFITQTAEERVASRQAAEIAAAGEARIARLVEEKRRLADALSMARMRAEMAADQFSEGQGRLTDALAETRRASLALDHHRERLSALTVRHEEEVASCADTRAQSAELVQELAEAGRLREDLTAERAVLTEALNVAAADRDASQLAAETLSDQLAALQADFAARTESQAEVYARIEDAARLSLDGLEGVFERASVDIDRILASVRRDYSGQGGLFEPIEGPAGFVDEDDADEGDKDARLNHLLDDLERVNALRTAVERMPFARPVGAARLTSSFGNRRDPFTKRRAFHAGIDYAAPRGTPIYTSGAGQVVFSGRQRGYGNIVKIRHAFGYETVYAHLHRRRVKVGDRVERGDRIGDMGNTGRSTGTHLHYEIRLNGKPVNPAKYIEAARNVL